MGNDEKPKKSEIEGTFVFDPTKTTKLGGPFADFNGELSVDKPKRPIPDEVRQEMDKEQAKAPKTSEAWYLKAREHLDSGREFLRRANKLINTQGNFDDVNNAFLGARARWISAQDALERARGFENKASLDETQRLIDGLRDGIDNAQHRLNGYESRR